jgi:hypothetical protein
MASKFIIKRTGKKRVWNVPQLKSEQRPTGEAAKAVILEKVRDLYFPSFDGAFDGLSDSELWDAIQEMFCFDLTKSWSSLAISEAGQSIASFYDKNK